MDGLGGFALEPGSRAPPRFFPGLVIVSSPGSSPGLSSAPAASGSWERRAEPLEPTGSWGLHPRPINPVFYGSPPRQEETLLADGRLFSGRGSRLDAFSGYPLRRGCPALPWRTTGTLEAATPRSSRTKGTFPSGGQHPPRVESDLSHDGLNPAHVPL